ncbi:MAG TPA: histidine kinase [Casimicrobiaceae bacterium]|jgi:signal transduction histidine kinase|nr:histidine kinase [Casimicrobiaceae bacterium]
MHKIVMDNDLPSGSGRECPEGSGHPLELIAYFRRFRPNLLRNLLYTFIWNMGFVVVFTVLGLLFGPKVQMGRLLWANFVIANCIGYLIHGGFALGNTLLATRIWERGFVLRSAYYAGITLVGVFGGYWLGFALLGMDDARGFVFSAQGAGEIGLLSLIIAAILASVFLARERQARAEAAFQRERARVEATEHQFHLAQLKMLEAQIEPHFLYNTLANVISLVDADPAAAKRMVTRLIDYLRYAAEAGGTGEATVGRQIELLQAYLDLMALRTNARLSYRVEMAPDVAALPLPPMLLQPLVENAIKHGLEPKIAGGQVCVGARREDSLLVLTVADNGLGFRTTRGDGTGGLGLANLRARLESLYGARARMTIEDTQPGTMVTLALPIGLAP